MYLDKTTRRYVLIGTLKGQGYSCKYDTVDTFEGSTNGLWNKVSSHMEWIQDTMEELGEKVCRGTNKKSSEELEENKLTTPKSLSPQIANSTNTSKKPKEKARLPRKYKSSDTSVPPYPKSSYAQREFPLKYS